MSLNHDLIGVETEPTERVWTAFDVQLYAVAVGAGQADPCAELQFTTDNTADIELRVLPTFANLLTARHGSVARLGDFDLSQYVHAEQAFTLHRPLGVEGRVRSTNRVVGMYDKGHAALVVSESRAVDASTGQLLITTRSSIFIKGEGGFGGSRGPSAAFAMPSDVEPDLDTTVATRPEQALIYRLTGDRNPLHSDPKFAANGGFDRPILHGMCTYGFTGRVLVNAFCDGDADRVTGMEARFANPMLPGDDLSVTAWRCDQGAYFIASSNDKRILDRGLIRFS